MNSTRIALGQINTIVGDLKGNTAKILDHIEQARALGVDIIAFPELAVTGYPPEDLLLKPKFVQDNLRHLDRIIAASKNMAVIVGFVDMREDLYNAAAIIQDRQIVGIYHKIYLPTYGVFDEDRYFQAGAATPVFSLCDTTVGVNICEDMWYPTGPSSAQSAKGALLIVNINGSPYHIAKRASRERMLATRAFDDLVIVAYVNLVGGQDELIFDGGSIIFDQRGEVIARGSQFEEDLVVADLDVEGVFRTRLHDPRRRKERRLLTAESNSPKPSSDAASDVSARPAGREMLPQAGEKRTIYPSGSYGEIYSALVLGTRDYVHKNHFSKVVIGLSGGIDSSLTAVIAADALGAENVVGVRMPSRFTSKESMEDAEQLAGNVGIEMLTIGIEPAFKPMLQMMEAAFKGTNPNVAEENMQARIRGNILMALSNKFGYLVLTTGNKSELATGYSTLYGDMAGGFSPLKDVYKTTVYGLARYREDRDAGSCIPLRVFEKAPTAELRPGQRDVDSLPPYEVLDPILMSYVEEDRSFDEIVGIGFDVTTVQRVISMVDRSEYKRRQSPPGLKITPRAFGRDRRLPITNHYSEL